MSKAGKLADALMTQAKTLRLVVRTINAAATDIETSSAELRRLAALEEELNALKSAISDADSEQRAAYVKAEMQDYSDGCYADHGSAKDQINRFAQTIESAATAPLLARIAELERQLEDARKDAETVTDEQLEAAVKAWFQEKIVPEKFPFRQRLRAAIAAAIKEQT